MTTGTALTLSASLACGSALSACVVPFPADGVLLANVHHHAPAAYYSMLILWDAVLCTLPLYVLLPVRAGAARLQPGHGQEKAGKLSPYPDPAQREQLFAVLGE